MTKWLHIQIQCLLCHFRYKRRGMESLEGPKYNKRPPNALESITTNNTYT